VIEGHRDVRAQPPLDLHGALRSERPGGSVDVALKLDSVLRDGSKTLKREDLKSA
jgi:hypothetical protein